jgi:hypothetical protein
VIEAVISAQNRAILKSKGEDETNLFGRSCNDQIRAQLDKPGRRPALTDNEIDWEIYPLKLEEASGKSLQTGTWNVARAIARLTT